MGHARTYHHRLSKFFGGNGDNGNTVLVPDKRHRAWHLLFSGEMKPQHILLELVRVWLPQGISLTMKYKDETWIISEKTFTQVTGE